MVKSGGLQPVLQAAISNGLSLDPFSIGQDGWAASEVNVGRGEIVDALVVAAVVVVVIDKGRDLGFEYPRNLRARPALTNDLEDANLVGWLEGWQRGFEPRLVHVSEKVPFDSDDITAVKLFQQLNTEAQHARNNAVGMLTVNISLAIRRALDHLA